MTNPYAPPDAESNPEPPGSPSLLKQFFWLVVACAAGVACGMVIAGLSLTFRLRHAIAKHVVGWAPLWIAVVYRAWFCRGNRQLITVTIVLSWSCLWTLAIISSILPIPFKWTGSIPAVVIFPTILTLIGWPVMALGKWRRIVQKPE